MKKHLLVISILMMVCGYIMANEQSPASAKTKNSSPTTKVNYENEADAAYKNKNLKAAVENMKLAIDANPGNAALKIKHESFMQELKKEMMELHQLAALEESAGNKEKAIGYWNKIIEKSVPEEDYYKKATIRLKKYNNK